MEKLEQMSSQELENMLREDFHDSGGGAADMSRLLGAAQILARREDAARRPDPDRAWNTFLEVYRPFVSAARRRVLAHALRVAAVSAAILVLITTTAAAMGYDLWGMLAGWTDEVLYLRPEQITPVQLEDIRIPPEPKEFEGLQQAVEAYGFSQRVMPRWMPEGFELAELIVDESLLPYNLVFIAFYQRGDDVLSMGADVHIGERQSVGQWQKDEGVPVAYKSGRKIHTITTNCGTPYAVWANGPMECFIYGDISMEELERMIDSLYQNQEE